MPHVLLLEPNTLLAATYQAAFVAIGYTATAVTGAQAGIHATDMKQPDAIVLELQLPRHNGIEFLYELRSYPEWQGIPIIINTSLVPAQTDAFGPVLRESLGVRTILYKHGATLADLVGAVRSQLVLA
jgi:DNA-binding response OmpR family regulator